MNFKFGKYKGRPIADVAKSDPSYFGWALENVSGFRAYAAGVTIDEKRTLQTKSSCGHGGIKNAGFPKPGRKKFVSKASPYYQPSLPIERGTTPMLKPRVLKTNSNPDDAPWDPDPTAYTDIPY